MAVGLLKGLAKQPRLAHEASSHDGGSSAVQLPDETAAAKLRREAAFPRYLLRLGSEERAIEEGSSSRAADTSRILNSVIALHAGPEVSLDDAALDATPPEKHESYARYQATN